MKGKGSQLRTPLFPVGVPQVASSEMLSRDAPSLGVPLTCRVGS